MFEHPVSTSLIEAFRLWAKSDPAGDRWHSLPFHLIDVGEMAGALWDLLPENSKAIPIRSFGDSETARRVAMFLAASHDVGKANRYFQAKDPRQQERLADLGVVNTREPKKHGQATSALLCPWIVSVWGWHLRSASSVAFAIGGHHGVFLDEPNSAVAGRLDLRNGYVPSVSTAVLGAIAELYGVNKAIPEPLGLNPLLAWLAGFVSVADWLGSHESLVTWRTKPCELAKYAKELSEKSASFLAEISWDSPHASAPLAISDLIPPGAHPNDLQAIAAAIGESDFGLAIVEAPTGEGKTEAAFALNEFSRSTGAGLYFALPTMATANGIFERVETYLKKATGMPDVEARLLHSQGWLYRQDFEGVPNSGQNEGLETGEDWFAGNKRGLLAPYGVGTIDQCLIGALKARHGFVRLFALAGKTIIVDEVHAYDVYMSDLLMRLIGWLRSLGCRVILLSATLPASRRAELFAAWGAAEPTGAEYPCITWVDPHGETRTRRLEVASRKSVRFELLPSSSEKSWKVGAFKALQLAEQTGGLVALIFNTVKDAQLAFSELVAIANPAVGIDLFHARFTVGDRKQIEQSVLSTYGKHGERGQTRVLIATQVVEQSLDLDFDHMISALAPIDLLIQRAGRLHRHSRSRSGQLLGNGGVDGRPPPTMYVLEPTVNEKSEQPTAHSVYAQDIMVKTHDFIRKGFEVRQPSDISKAIDHVYDVADRERDREEWANQFNKGISKSKEKRDSHHGSAQRVMICPVGGVDLITDSANGLDENDDFPGSEAAARTRLEDLPSISLVLFHQNDEWPPSQFGKDSKRSFAMNTVRTPAFAQMLEELCSLPKPQHWNRSGASRYSVPVKVDSNGVFETASYIFRYDKTLGLVVQDKNA